MNRSAKTVAEYLRGLPVDRRKALEAVRRVIRKNLPKGYKEGMQYGMIGYFVPHSIYPDGYHCDPSQPLPFAGLGNQKNHMGLYMMCVYSDESHKDRFVREWKAAGKKLDMGKACVRFKKIEDVPLEVVGDAIARVPVKDFVAHYESGLGHMARKRPAKKTSKKKTTKKPAAKKTARKRTTKKISKKVSRKKTTRKKAARR